MHDRVLEELLEVVRHTPSRLNHQVLNLVIGQFTVVQRV